MNGVPQNLRHHFVVEFSLHECEKFNNLLPKVCELVSRIDPLHSVALMSSYGLMGTLEEQDAHKLRKIGPIVQQGHIEFLQALCLRNSLESTSEFPEPDSIQKLFDWLPELFEAYQNMRPGISLSSNESDLSSEQLGVAKIQAYLRAHASLIRNWGYFGYVTRISKELFSRIDDDYERVAGMKLSKVVEIFEGLIRRHEDKVYEHREKLHNVFQHRTVISMVDAFFCIFEPKGETEKFRIRLSAPGVTRLQALAELMNLADRFVGPTFILSVEEIAKDFNVELKAIVILANRLSLAFGDLTG